jgi:hypothetical protein
MIDLAKAAASSITAASQAAQEGSFRGAAEMMSAGSTGFMRLPANACAVGYTDTDTTFIVHWNGKAWKRQPTPRLASGSGLFGV